METNQPVSNTYSIPNQNPSQNNFNQPQPNNSPPPIVPPLPKKTFPKAAIYGIAGAVLLIVAFFIIKIVGSQKSTAVAGGTITWWGLWEDQSTVQPLIDSYQSQHPGVKINYIKQSPQDYRERLTSALAKGVGPDIFSFHNSWTPMFRSNLDPVPSGVINPSDFTKNFYPIASSDLVSGPNIVGVPLEYDALTLFVNDDIFTKSGKTPPATWDDFRNIAKSLTVKDDQGVITQAGAAMGRTENVDHWPEILGLLMLQNGVDLSNPIGKAAEGALTYFTVFSTIDGVWDATLPSSTQAFAGGKLAMYIAPSWRSFEITQANPNLKFKTVPIPQLPKDSPNQPDITYATYWAQGVWSGSKNKQTAWNFVKFISTQDSLTKMYQNASKIRSFGEPYPSPLMSSLLSKHPILGSIVNQAPGAKSWYLASRTFDGPTGINSQMANYFGDAINAVAAGTSTPDKVLPTVAQGVQQILTQYKLITN